MFTVKLGDDREYPYAILEDDADYNAGNSLYAIRRDHAAAQIAPEVVATAIAHALRELQAVADLVTPDVWTRVERELYGAPPASAQAVTLAVGAGQTTLTPTDEGLAVTIAPFVVPPSLPNPYATLLRVCPVDWTDADWEMLPAAFAAQQPQPVYPFFNPRVAKWTPGIAVVFACGDTGACWEWQLTTAGQFELVAAPHENDYRATLALNPADWTAGDWAVVTAYFAAQHPHPRRPFTHPRVYQQDEHCIVFVCGTDPATWTWEVNRNSGQFYE